jgi:hypothetical protein
MADNPLRRSGILNQCSSKRRNSGGGWQRNGKPTIRLFVEFGNPAKGSNYRAI